MFYLMLEANTEETCNMIVVNNNNIPNKKIIESLGIVQGSTVRARNVARDIFAKIRTFSVDQTAPRCSILGKTLKLHPGS